MVKKLPFRLARCLSCGFVCFCFHTRLYQTKKCRLTCDKKGLKGAPSRPAPIPLQLRAISHAELHYNVYFPVRNILLSHYCIDIQPSMGHLMIDARVRHEENRTRLPLSDGQDRVSMAATGARKVDTPDSTTVLSIDTPESWTRIFGR